MTDQPVDPTANNIQELQEDEQIEPARDDHPDNENDSDEAPVEADVDGDEEDQTDVDIPEELYQEADNTSPEKDE